MNHQQQQRVVDLWHATDKVVFGSDREWLTHCETCNYRKADFTKLIAQYGRPPITNPEGLICPGCYLEQWAKCVRAGLRDAGLLR